MITSFWYTFSIQSTIFVRHLFHSKTCLFATHRFHKKKTTDEKQGAIWLHLESRRSRQQLNLAPSECPCTFVYPPNYHSLMICSMCIVDGWSLNIVLLFSSFLFLLFFVRSLCPPVCKLLPGFGHERLCYLSCRYQCLLLCYGWPWHVGSPGPLAAVQRAGNGCV